MVVTGISYERSTNFTVNCGIAGLGVDWAFTDSAIIRLDDVNAIMITKLKILRMLGNHFLVALFGIKAFLYSFPD